MYPRRDIQIGAEFGRLTVIAEAEKSKHGIRQFAATCACGGTAVVAVGALGRTVNSCGCLKRESAHSITHGHTKNRSRSRTYRVWVNMWSRCTNPNASQYADYGGRGISIDPAWRDFTVFLRDNGEAPEGMTLDRIDNDGDYKPDNARWATKTEQANNRRSNRLITFNDETLTLANWSRRLNLKIGTLHARLKSGQSIERALTTPLRVW